MTETFKPKVYIKDRCPFCIKLLRFLTDAGLLSQFEIITVQADNYEDLSYYRNFLQEKTGQRASFPTVEIAPGEFMAESEDLIDYYAAQNDIDRTQLMASSY